MSDPPSYPYATFLDVKFPPLSVVDVPALIAACKDRWYNQTLCKVNDSVIRLGVMQGEYHWHRHERDDEFFFVLEGRFIIDLEGRSVDLGPFEGFVVPKGLLHRTRAPERAVILMAETSAIIPTGDPSSRRA
jgi:Cupin domain